jgi:creatinine amidohydrolase
MDNLDVRWGNLTAPELRSIAGAPNSLAILPIGALEQHGPHLSTMTDTVGAEEVAVAAARRLQGSQPVAVLPGLWLGMSEHHLPFGGTISVDFETLNMMLRSIGRSVVSAGFKRLLVLNGHGGNVEALTVIVRELGVALSLPVCTVTPWFLIGKELSAILEDDKGDGHACEGETSFMMAVRPDHVRPERFAEAAAGQSRLMTDIPVPSRFFSFAEYAPLSGTWGTPTRATAEKGQKILDALTKVTIDILSNPKLWTHPDQVWTPDRGQGPTDRAVR